MREVDTDALLGVAGLLGIGNPHTVVGQVEFQDEVLQQVLDVSSLLGRQSGFIQQAGVSSTAAMSSVTRSAVELNSLLNLGVLEQAEAQLGVTSVSQLDAYLLRVQIQIDAADVANIAELMIGYQYNDDVSDDQHEPRIIFRSTTTTSGDPMRVGGRLDMANRPDQGHLQNCPLLPAYLPWRSELLTFTEAGAAGALDAFFNFDLWICRKGVPLNFAI